MKNSICLLFVFFFFGINVDAQHSWSHGRLKVSADGHSLQYEDGTPFFWLGDTGWELFQRLKLDEIKSYLENRSSKGFNVIQAVALAEFNGLRQPNRYGELPFKNLDPNHPNGKYFAIIDSTIKMAMRLHLFIGLLPTWGDKVTKLWGEGPVVFDSVNAYTYGKWIGQRYKKYPNIIWILGGDRPALIDSSDWRPVWRQMARGIQEATKQKCFITYHPSGGSNSTSQWIHTEPWLSMNMFQSGHGGGHDVPAWDLVTRDRKLLPTKPTLDAEPNYEDHPVNPWPKWNSDNGYFRDYDVRKQTYRSVFAGAAGVTYGNHAVWQFMSERDEAVNYADRGWRNAIDRLGAYQVGHLRRLIESWPFMQRIPDDNLIIDGQGNGGEHMEAFRSADGSYAMVYLPVGKAITVSTAWCKHGLTGWWFNPKDASVQVINGLVSTDGSLTVTPPVTGQGNDWVLVLDDQTARYSVPGKY